ncbi:MAG: hypothetical protein L0312_05655 [Acidobacteria bacterium]|nr:hypothetical protein [Acidobacteriota bacterium]
MPNGDTGPYTGFGSAILNTFTTQDRRRKQEEVAKFFADIQAAGSRERALDVVKNYSNKFESPQDFTTAFRSVDEFYPEASKELRQIVVYDEDTGEATPRFVPSSEAVSLESPEVVKQRFGPKATLTKPDLETFYSPEDEQGRVRILGKLPVSRRPEGAVTLPELTESRRVREEARREERDRFSREKFEAWFGLAEQRWASALGKLGETAGDKELQRGRALLNDATRLTALSLNAKMLPDGSFSFDDDNRTKLFNDRLRFMQESIQMDPGVLRRPTGGLELHTKASKALPLTSEIPQPPPPALAPKEPGIISKLFGKKEGEPTKPPAKKAEGDAAAQIKAKAAEINARTDITPEQKKAVLDKLRSIAKQNNVKAEF